MADNTKTYTLRLKIDGKEIPNSVNDLAASQRKLKKELRGLEQGTDAYIKKSQQLRQVSKRLDEVRSGVNEVGKSWKRQQSMWSKAKSTFMGTFGAITLDRVIGQVQQLAVNFAEFIKDLTKHRREITRMTGAVGQELDVVNSKITSIVKTFDQDFNEVLIAANSYAEQMDISLVDALENMQTGFANGADSSGEFIAQLKEYPAQFRAAGISADQALAIMTQEAKSGIYSDKGVDIIKEGTLGLRKMTKVTREALETIGISSDQLEKDLRDNTITYFEAIQMVSNKLGELPPQSVEVGTALADIFGGAGEDAGLEYIKMLGNVQTQLENVETPTSRLAQANERLALSYQKLSDDNGAMTEWAIAWKNAWSWLLDATFSGPDRAEQILSDWAKIKLAATLAGKELSDLSSEDQKTLLADINSQIDSLNEMSDKDINAFLTKLREAQTKTKNLSEDQVALIRQLREQFTERLKALNSPDDDSTTTTTPKQPDGVATATSLAKESAPKDFDFSWVDDPEALYAEFAPAFENLMLQLQHQKGELYENLDEMAEKSKEKFIDGTQAEMDAETQKTEHLLSEDEKRRLIDEQALERKQQLIEATILQGMQSVENAESIEDYGKAVLGMARREIQAAIAKGIANAIASQLGTGPIGIFTAGAAGIAAQAIFNQIVPSFATGGWTGRGDMGLGRNSGGYIRGTIEEDEYVLSKNMLRDPYVANVTRYIEDSRKYGVNSSQPPKNTSQLENSSSVSLDAREFKEGAMIIKQVALVLQEKGIPAYFTPREREKSDDYNADRQRARSRGSLT